MPGSTGFPPQNLQSKNPQYLGNNPERTFQDRKFREFAESRTSKADYSRSWWSPPHQGRGDYTYANEFRNNEVEHWNEGSFQQHHIASNNNFKQDFPPLPGSQENNKDPLSNTKADRLAEMSSAITEIKGCFFLFSMNPAQADQIPYNCNNQTTSNPSIFQPTAPTSPYSSNQKYPIFYHHPSESEAKN